jgi:hypothetical protein
MSPPSSCLSRWAPCMMSMHDEHHAWWALWSAHLVLHSLQIVGGSCTPTPSLSSHFKLSLLCLRVVRILGKMTGLGVQLRGTSDGTVEAVAPWYMLGSECPGIWVARYGCQLHMIENFGAASLHTVPEEFSLNNSKNRLPMFLESSF